MADETMLDLGSASQITTTDQLWIVQGGTDKRAAMSLILAYVGNTTVVGSTIVTANADYDMVDTDQFVYLTGAYTRNVNLLSAASMQGHFVWIKADGNATAHPQTIVPNGSDTIEGLSSVALNGPYQWVLLYAVESGLWLLMT